MELINFQKCCSEPKHFLRFAAVIICACLASYQLSGCVRKILHPPISTHYGFNLNQTIDYPCITICRYPAFKSSLYGKYGLIASPLLTQSWRTFKFNETTLEDMFADLTYNLTEFIPYYGFAGSMTANLNIKHFYSLNGGRCYTFEPKNDSYPWSKDTMYVFYLHNSVSENMVQARRNEPPIQLSQMGRVAAGFHVFIHARSEMFADQEYQEDSFMEYIYVEAGENIKVNLRPSEFKQLPTKDNFCNESREYAKSKCHESCVHELITSYVGCSTPWMRNPQLPECSDFESIKEIIQSYTLNRFRDSCVCQRSCDIIINKPFVQNRRDFPYPDTTLTLSFDSNLVTSMTEVVAYDWNIFLADLGGSLGFLLGLSVLGIIGVLEELLKIIVAIFNMLLPKKRTEGPQNSEKGDKDPSDFKEESIKRKY